MQQDITASILYDYVRCPHRVMLDLFMDPKERDEISAFVKLLWEKGHAFESEVIKGMEIPFTDLSGLREEERERATTKAMGNDDELIYSGRIRAGNLLGVPDLLRKQRGGYIPGDIKSGAALEGGSDLEDGDPKKHYAVQLALYTDILKKKGCLADMTPFIWDVHGDEIVYDLGALQGRRNQYTLWSVYENALLKAETIVNGQMKTKPALASKCKMCHWHTHCKSEIKKTNDLTLIPDLGRSKRDTMIDFYPTVKDLAAKDLSRLFSSGETGLSGIRIGTLKKFQIRAQLLTNPNAKPMITQPINFPNENTEIFFDVETDPMRDICYLHGSIIRQGKDNSTEKYVEFYADNPTPEEEEKAFAEAVQFLRSAKPWAMYFYSKYERTTWRKLQAKYPHVIDAEEVEELFDPKLSIDLYYDVVKTSTEWPANDQSIKTLAQYLGFSWRDTDPSGAASIEWYHRWVETKDPKIKQRILDYNEDDCRATRVLLDGIEKLIP